MQNNLQSLQCCLWIKSWYAEIPAGMNILHHFVAVYICIYTHEKGIWDI